MAQISPVPLGTDAALTRLTFVVSKESALSPAGETAQQRILRQEHPGHSNDGIEEGSWQKVGARVRGRLEMPEKYHRSSIFEGRLVGGGVAQSLQLSAETTVMLAIPSLP